MIDGDDADNDGRVDNNIVEMIKYVQIKETTVY